MIYVEFGGFITIRLLSYKMSLHFLIFFPADSLSSMLILADKWDKELSELITVRRPCNQL